MQSIGKEEETESELQSQYLGIEADESNDTKMTDNEAFMAYISKSEND